MEGNRKVMVWFSAEQYAWIRAKAPIGLASYVRDSSLRCSGWTAPVPAPAKKKYSPRALKPLPEEAVLRRKQMSQMRMDGKTLQEIGDEFGITRERVRQLTRGTVLIQTIRKRLDNDIDLRIANERKAAKAIANWWSHVDKGNNEESCWSWRGAKTGGGGGYGHFRSPRLFGSEQSAHRQSFFLHNGYFPKRPMNVLHRCNNSVCVRPDHLYEGTMKENTADAVAARDGVHWSSSAHNAERDAAIFQRARDGESALELAEAFGLCRPRIYKIIKAAKS